MPEQMILQGGALAVVCLICYMLAHHLTKANLELASTVAKQAEQTVMLVTNHLAHSDEILQRVCVCTDANTEALKELREEFRRK